MFGHVECPKRSVALALVLVAPPFSGPFVGASPKNQTNIYCTVLDPWFITSTATNIKNDALDRYRGPFPLTKEANTRRLSLHEYGQLAASDGYYLILRRPQPKIALAKGILRRNSRIEEPRGCSGRGRYRILAAIIPANSTGRCPSWTAAVFAGAATTGDTLRSPAAGIVT